MGLRTSSCRVRSTPRTTAPGSPVRRRRRSTDREIDARWEALRADGRRSARAAVCTRRAPRPCSASAIARRDWLVIGEAPRRGRGSPGRALRRPRRPAPRHTCCGRIGLERARAPTLRTFSKCRPPSNREPEARRGRDTACRTSTRQIELIKPRILCAVGPDRAHRTCSHTDTPIGRMRGQVHFAMVPARSQVVVTYHPAYLLRSPGEKRKAWNRPAVRTGGLAAVATVASEVASPQLADSSHDA